MGVLLAAIDHNMHLFHKPKQSKRGRIVATGNYSKELNVHGEVVKEEKDYRYFQYMSARMFKTRADFPRNCFIKDTKYIVGISK